MEVKYSPEVRLGTTAFGLLAQATTTLRNVPQLKETKTVEAGWDAVQDDEGRTLYRLTLKDFTGAVFTDFSPDELKIPMHLHFRIHRLWGELLQIRSEQLHQETKVLLAQMYAGQE